MSPGLGVLLSTVLVTARSAPAVTVTVSVEESFDDMLSKAVLLTVAVLDTLGYAAEPTLTVRVRAGRLEPDGTGEEVQSYVKTMVGAPLVSTDHPVPENELYVRPEGSTSVTVTTPSSASGPLFVTVMVKSPVPPVIKFPVCVFDMERSAARLVTDIISQLSRTRSPAAE